MFFASLVRRVMRIPCAPKGDRRLKKAVRRQPNQLVVEPLEGRVMLNADLSFLDARRDFETGGLNTAVVVDDFNRDGISDLAVTDTDIVPNEVFILLGNGDGTFAAPRDFRVGTRPIALAVGDFNGDGNPDLATTNSVSNNVSILLGNGDGTFQTAVNVAVGLRPEAVALGDFNGDGKPDLAVANYNSNNVSILLGNGDGMFQAAQNFAAGREPSSVAVGDFNGDTFQDLAVANPFPTPGGVSVLLGNGDGTFQPAQVFEAGRNPISVAIGDFNGDGIADLAAASFSTPSVAVLLGNGDGTFAAAQSVATGASGLRSVTVGDFNGDNRQDLAVTNWLTDTVSVALGNGDGTFQPGQPYLVGGRAWTVAVGDFNRDGAQDLAAGASHNVSVLLGRGDGTFRTAPTYAVGSSPEAVAVGDFNGDGVPDLAVANGLSNDVSVLLGNGDGTFAAALFVGVGSRPNSVAVGDFNGDGVLDLATANGGSNDVSVLLGNGDGTFQAAQNFAAGSVPVSVLVADFNNDGVADLAVADDGFPAGVSILLGNGDGTFQPPRFRQVSQSIASSLTAGDFDGDGRLDVAVMRVDTQNRSVVQILLGNGDGTLREGPGFLLINARGPSFITSGDFNGDGLVDLVVANPTRSSAYSLLGNGDGTFRIAQELFVRAQSKSVAVGDFDGDGRLDLAVVTNVHNVSFRLGNGDGTFGRPQNFGVERNPGEFMVPGTLGVGDFNGDGRLDLAVPNAGSASVSLLLNETAPPFTGASQGGAAAGTSIGQLRGAGSGSLLGSPVGDRFGSVLSTAAGEAFTIARTFAVGGEPVGPFTIAYWASLDDIFGNEDDFLVGVELIAGAAPGIHSGTSPAFTIGAAGSYFLFAVLDSDGQVNETDEDNNLVMALATLLVSELAAAEEGTE